MLAVCVCVCVPGGGHDLYKRDEALYPPLYPPECGWRGGMASECGWRGVCIDKTMSSGPEERERERERECVCAQHCVFQLS